MTDDPRVGSTIAEVGLLLFLHFKRVIQTAPTQITAPIADDKATTAMIPAPIFLLRLLISTPRGSCLPGPLMFVGSPSIFAFENAEGGGGGSPKN
jgi:hypothetical protein